MEGYNYLTKRVCFGKQLKPKALEGSINGDDQVITLNIHKHTMTSIYIITVLLQASSLFAQNIWSQSYGGEFTDEGQSAIETSDNAYLVAGSTESFGSGGFDGWLVKTDHSGDTLWTKTYGGNSSDRAKSLIETLDQAYLFAGETFSYGAGGYDAWLVKTDLNGDTLWTKTYGGTEADYAMSVIESSDQAYLILGHTHSYGSGRGDFWLVKTDINGDTLWTRTFGGGQDDLGFSLIETSDQAYLLAGHTKSYGSGAQDAWIIKTDLNGDTLWTQTYGGILWDRATSIIETSDQAYLMVGYTESYSLGYKEAWIVKTDLDGETLWNRTYDGDEESWAWGGIETSDQGFVVTGYTWSFATNSLDALLIKTDANGDALWTKTYGGLAEESTFSVVETSDQGFLISGWTESYGSASYNVFLIKTDSLGNSAIPVSIQNVEDQVRPTSLSVFPNPSNNECMLTYTLPEHSSVNIDIFDLSGNNMWNHDYGKQGRGTYTLIWNHQDRNGNMLGSGVYVLRISTSSWIESKKILLLK